MCILRLSSTVSQILYYSILAFTSCLHRASRLTRDKECCGLNVSPKYLQVEILIFIMTLLGDGGLCEGIRA